MLPYHAGQIWLRSARDGSRAGAAGRAAQFVFALTASSTTHGACRLQNSTISSTGMFRTRYACVYVYQPSLTGDTCHLRVLVQGPDEESGQSDQRSCKPVVHDYNNKLTATLPSHSPLYPAPVWQNPV